MSVMIKDFKYLVVDDFPALRKMIVAALKGFGADLVIEASDGNSALTLLKSQSVDIIITDWNMPGMSGLDLIRTIKKNPVHAKMIALMLTSDAKKENVIAAAQAGADGYLLKPFSPKVLEEKLLKILQKRAATSGG